MENKYRFLLVLLILFVGWGNSYAQNTDQAVMQIKAEVVAGTQIEENTARGNVSNKGKSGVITQSYEYGKFKLHLPEGVRFLVTVEGNTKFTIETDNFTGDSKSGIVKTSDGAHIQISLNSQHYTGSIPYGTYSDSQTAVIEYF